MGIASLVLGIISLIFGIILGWIPFIGFIFPILAIVGLILGIVDTAKKSQTDDKKGISIAGLVTSAFAVIVTISMFFISGALSLVILSEM
ncbi:MAG: hypothetical protein IJ777_04645 [Clostridia bacterium]|nr:hypothetical protein [Clostridia bacterium]